MTVRKHEKESRKLVGVPKGLREMMKGGQFPETFHLSTNALGV